MYLYLFEIIKCFPLVQEVVGSDEGTLLHNNDLPWSKASIGQSGITCLSRINRCYFYGKNHVSRNNNCNCK